MQPAAGLGVSAQFLQPESPFVVRHECADASISICEIFGRHSNLGRATQEPPNGLSFPPLYRFVWVSMHRCACVCRHVHGEGRDGSCVFSSNTLHLIWGGGFIGTLTESRTHQLS